MHTGLHDAASVICRKYKRYKPHPLLCQFYQVLFSEAVSCAFAGLLPGSPYIWPASDQPHASAQQLWLCPAEPVLERALHMAWHASGESACHASSCELRLQAAEIFLFLQGIMSSA